MKTLAKSAAGALAISLLATGTILAQAYKTPAPVSSPSTNPAQVIKIVTPSEGQTIYGDKIPVLLSLDNAGGLNHVLLWLDDQSPTKDSAQKITGDNTIYNDVAYGNHKLVAELVNNDNSSLNPPATFTVNFKTSPIASPTPVVSSGFDKNTALVILVIVALVIISAWWFTKDEDMPTPMPSTPGSKKTTKKRSKSRK